MNFYLVSDTHFNHAQIATYCDRPKDFTETIIRNWQNTIAPEDCVIHLGDVFIGKAEGWDAIWPGLTGRKILIRGNHDRQRSRGWWMRHGFEFACDGMIFNNCWLTHEPSLTIPDNCEWNLHGHLHNVWHVNLPYHDQTSCGVYRQRKLPCQFNRLFAVEYTKYMPIEFNKFVAHPERYQAVKKA